MEILIVQVQVQCKSGWKQKELDMSVSADWKRDFFWPLSVNIFSVGVLSWILVELFSDCKVGFYSQPNSRPLCTIIRIKCYIKGRKRNFFSSFCPLPSSVALSEAELAAAINPLSVLTWSLRLRCGFFLGWQMEKGEIKDETKTEKE